MLMIKIVCVEWIMRMYGLPPIPRCNRSPARALHCFYNGGDHASGRDWIRVVELMCIVNVLCHAYQAVAHGLLPGQFRSTILSSIIESVQLSVSCSLHVVFVFLFRSSCLELGRQIMSSRRWSKHSGIWDFMEKIKARKVLTWCKLCKQKFVCHPSQTTSNWLIQLDRKHNDWKKPKECGLQTNFKPTLYLFRLVLHETTCMFSYRTFVHSFLKVMELLLVITGIQFMLILKCL